MAGNTPITTRTGIGSRGPATIAAARTQATAVAEIGEVLPVVVDPAAAVAAATQVAGTIIIIRRLHHLPHLAIRVGVQALERAAVIARHQRRYIGIRSRIDESKIVSTAPGSPDSSPPRLAPFALPIRKVSITPQ
jgi:hypothetical protein